MTEEVKAVETNAPEAKKPAAEKTAAKKTTTKKSAPAKRTASKKTEKIATKAPAKKTATKKVAAKKPGRPTKKKLGKIIFEIDGQQIDYKALEKKAAKLGGDVYVVANEKKIYDVDGKFVDLF